MYNHTTKQVAEMIQQTFNDPKFNSEPTQVEKDCSDPCRKMKNTVSLVADDNNVIGYHTQLKFRFEKSVRVEKKVVVYTWFKFIIDAGSSLGLWLGLSVLGIIDLTIGTFMLIKKWMKKRKVLKRSVT